MPKIRSTTAWRLLALGARRIRLLSNNPDKQEQLERCGIVVAACEPTAVNLSTHNRRYLASKRDQAGHLFAEAVLGPGASGA